MGKFGLAVPYFELEESGGTVAAGVEVGDEELVVFWKKDRRGAMAFYPRAEFPDGSTRRLEFRAPDDKIVDVETASRWTLDGRARAGPLRGSQLEPVARAYVAYWFAWALFQPETRIWESAASMSSEG